MTNLLPALAKNLAIVGFATLSSSTVVNAADVFAPPATKISSNQEDRIARLEAALEKAMAKMESPSDLRNAESNVKLNDPIQLPLPPANAKASQASKEKSAATTAAVHANEAEERVLGVMNDSEIYIAGGMVRQRKIDSVFSLPPVTPAVRSAKQ